MRTSSSIRVCRGFVSQILVCISAASLSAVVVEEYATDTRGEGCASRDGPSPQLATEVSALIQRGVRVSRSIAMKAATDKRSLNSRESLELGITELTPMPTPSPISELDAIQAPEVDELMTRHEHLPTQSDNKGQFVQSLWPLVVIAVLFGTALHTLNPCLWTRQNQCSSVINTTQTDLKGCQQTLSCAHAVSAEVVLHRCAVLKISGMFCTACSSAVERALRGTAQVIKCEVNLIEEKANVHYTVERGFKVTDLCETIEDIGFEARILHDVAVEESSTDVASGALALLHLCDAEASPVSKLHLETLEGVSSVVAKGGLLQVTYDPSVIGSRAIVRSLKAVGCHVEVEPLGSAHSKFSPEDTQIGGLCVSVTCASMVMLICWVLPCIKHCLPYLYREVIPGIDVMTFSIAMLSTVVQVVSGKRFYVGAYHSIRSGVWDMNVLISLGAGLTFLYSLGIMFFSAITFQMMGAHKCKSPPVSYFETPCMVITFVLVGKTLEGWAKGQTSSALRELFVLKPKTAHLLHGTDEVGDVGSPGAVTEKTVDRSNCVVIPAELVQLGDVLQVFNGEAAPADGVMCAENGVAEFDESMLTGESRPVMKAKGDFIIGGSKCVNGRAELRVERLGNRSMLSQIMDLVERAQSSKAPVQQVADDIASRFVPFVVALAIMTWTVWWFLVYFFHRIRLDQILKGRKTDWPELERFFFVLEHGLTVLLVACPCALGLATPAAVMTATGVAARMGVLVRRGALPLELGSKVTHVILDKTGTLTCGTPRVTEAAAIAPDIQLASASSSGHEVPTAWHRLLAAYRSAPAWDTCAVAVGTGPISEVTSVESSTMPPLLWLERSNCDEASTEQRFRDVHLRDEAARALWWAVGCAEMSSEHPLAKQLAEVSRASTLRRLQEPSHFESNVGVGVRCSVAGIEIDVAAARRLLAVTKVGSEYGRSLLDEWVARCGNDGATVVAIAVDGEALGVVALEDPLVEHARACVDSLHSSGKEVWMCTGDHAGAARVIAQKCGVPLSRVVSEALPADKVALVHRLKSTSSEAGNRGGHPADEDPASTTSSVSSVVVAMVGDGVNDAPALATADVGVAIGASHDVTVDAADVVLVRVDLRSFVHFLELSRQTLGIVWRNFLWALVFNLCTLPIAAGAFWFYELSMSPPIAVGCMLSSSFFVVLSSLSLKHFQPSDLGPATS
eukprot:TRINITY_DN12638_c0_g1_i8.p1 TRINITY_DN12638_c0_g1~~TRINITY_DN12638_c0_g1_i8.p1  ORF type:complete len:1192 (+),score=165.16 TRINITY_DN12638_c0_g1_i8:112-3687(+)